MLPLYTVEYDPMSVMHFHDRAYSVNGHATIVPLISGLSINPSEDLSLLDKMKLRIFFGHECKKRDAGNLLEMCKMVIYRNNKNTKNIDTAVNSKNVTESTEDVSQNKGDKANNNITVSGDSANEDNIDDNDGENNDEKEKMPAIGASVQSEID
ncbi:unnamed protein product [Parnassius mnemosyne]|uniref:Uncharacterized protein n=1 Tax=Parnassius mnemosyne TaxID=213953 RepID=A0AAV1L5V0_9NEOP